jgi:hypothetical protein
MSRISLREKKGLVFEIISIDFETLFIKKKRIQMKKQD